MNKWWEGGGRGKNLLQLQTAIFQQDNVNIILSEGVDVNVLPPIMSWTFQGNDGRLMAKAMHTGDRDIGKKIIVNGAYMHSFHNRPLMHMVLERRVAFDWMQLFFGAGAPFPMEK